MESCLQYGEDKDNGCSRDLPVELPKESLFGRSRGIGIAGSTRFLASDSMVLHV
jgi:hypothetical protein